MILSQEQLRQRADVKRCPTCGSTRLIYRQQYGMMRFKCQKCMFEHFG